eukprot:5537663-Lingulodinium_polyedra.AAC.1
MSAPFFGARMVRAVRVATRLSGRALRERPRHCVGHIFALHSDAVVRATRRQTDAWQRKPFTPRARQKMARAWCERFALPR